MGKILKQLRRYVFCALGLLSVLRMPAQGQELSHLAGAFADLHLGVRPAAMAGAYTALSNDGNAILYNPAATAFANHGALSATSTRMFRIVPATFLGVHYPFRRVSWVGGFQQVGDDLLRETTVALAIAFRAADLAPQRIARLAVAQAFALSATIRYRQVSFGNNEDGGENRIRGDGRGFALDFGLFFKMNGMRFGMTWQDAIGEFRWDSSGRGGYVQNIPGRLRFGLAYAKPHLRFSLDFQPALYSDVNTRVLTGVETNIVEWLVIRGGIAQNIGGRFENKVATMGFGVYSLSIKRYRLAIQASYRTGELDSAYRFGIDLFWPQRRR